MTVPIMGIVSDHLQGLKNVTLVHGIVSGQGPIDGFWFTHAWVEGVTADGIKMVIDASTETHCYASGSLLFDRSN